MPEVLELRDRIIIFRQMATALYLVLSIGICCIVILHGRVNYPAWALIGPNEFPAFHHTVTDRTFMFLVPFLKLDVPLSIIMIWLRAPAISRWLLGFVATIFLFESIITARLVIPIQKQLYENIDRSKLPELLNHLNSLDLHFRTWPLLTALIALLIMVFQGLRAGSQTVEA